MSPFQPVIAPEIFALRHDFRALSILAEGVANSPGTPEATAALQSKAHCAEPWAEAHREAWREAYRAFGAKAVAVGVTEGGHFVVKDATGFSLCYVYARKDEALRSNECCAGSGSAPYRGE